jgi:hypothetical protein
LRESGNASLWQDYHHGNNLFFRWGRQKPLGKPEGYGWDEDGGNQLLVNKIGFSGQRRKYQPAAVASLLRGTTTITIA